MPSTRAIFLTTLAMLAFAGNSILTRIALKNTSIDAASFAAVRLISGALALWLLVKLRNTAQVGSGNWLSAAALFVYAAGFSFAYISLPTASGALILFGSVQATMIGYGLWKGERLTKLQWLGLMLAFGGLIGLLLPGLSAPPLAGSLLMMFAGLAWGVYSLRGRGQGDATQVTAGNFVRAVPLALIMSLILLNSSSLDLNGLLLAIASGAITSGIGYAIWYSALPMLKATHASVVQLSVPMLAAFGGVIFLGEGFSPRLIFASVAILGGIALVIYQKRHQ